MAQSGWQVTQTLEELKVLDGQDETHLPPDASWLLEQVRQNVELPAQELHEASQAKRKDVSDLQPIKINETTHLYMLNCPEEIGKCLRGSSKYTFLATGRNLEDTQCIAPYQ